VGGPPDKGGSGHSLNRRDWFATAHVVLPLCHHERVELERQAVRSASSSQLSYSPGLDGLRAVAVLSVMVFHDGFSWLPGGFYGVDAFFVLSGYLITSLLVTESFATGTIRLGRFWARRARRLLPALLFLVTALALVHLVSPSLLPWSDAVPDAAATLGYFANWHFNGSNSPLLHTWSLAIEEQFYLVWPLVVIAVLGIRRRKGRANIPDEETGLPATNHRRRLICLGVISGAGALLSAAWMWHLTPSGAVTPYAYYGTDSRAQSILVGAGLAIALQLCKSRSERVQRLGALSGVAGLAAGVLIWHSVSQESLIAFHGGFLLASLASAAVVAGVVLAPGGPVSRVLSFRPVRYVGKISYGAYLWYWPVTLVVTADRTRLGTLELFSVRTALTLGFAALSSRFIELPVRRGTLPARRALIGAPAAAGLALGLVALSASAIPASALSAAPVVKYHDANAVSASRAAAKRPPVRVLLVGDSMAGSLGAGLEPEAAEYGVEIINEGHPGCGASSDSKYRFALYINPPGKPCEIGQPDALLDQWQRWVDEYRPQVVVYLARADLIDQDLNGSWTWIGEPSFDRFLSSQLRKGVSILASRGARVVLMTSPYYNSASESGGPLLPEDQPGRVKIDDQILSQIASTSPGVSTFPLGQLVTPAGQFQPDVDSVDVRCDDGVHFSAGSGQILAPRILPALISLARSAVVTPDPDPPPLPPPVPGWYDQLPCGGP
jgi:peptidoglycan/LPS O-acetylase OafA/YrhL